MLNRIQNSFGTISGWILLLSTWMLSGCAVGPNYHRPTVQTPPAFHGPDQSQQLQPQSASFADLPWWQKIPRYRNPKFTCNMGAQEFDKHREFTARHAVRQLGLGAEVFPVWVSLYFVLKDPPPLGIGVADPMAPTRVQVLDRYQFASLKEVRP